MKKLLIILLGIALVLPLYSQEDGSETYNGGFENGTGEEFAPEERLADEGGPKKESAPKPEKKKTDYARQAFEMGYDVGIGFDNGLAGLGDIFTKDVVIDLGKIAKGVPDDGAGLNVGPSVDFFANVMNIHIGQGIWNFGFIFGVDGNIKLNISKSLFTLISEGNINKHDSSGKIGASGGIFTEIALKGSAKYQLFGKTLSAGVKPAVFFPLVYMPSSAGISYSLKTKKGDEEGIFINTKGGIEIYSASSLENLDVGSLIFGAGGFDLSIEGEYALFPFLDVGAGSQFPFAPATLTNQMKIGLKDEINIPLTGADLIAGNTPEIPEIDFENSYNSVKKEVHRPLRFDFYARYKPFDSEFLVIRPNIGFSVNVNKGDEEGFFNVGLEARLNLINLFIVSLSTGYRETIWRQRLGLTLNLRAFEMDLSATLRDHTFEGIFMGRGFEFSMGMRFGW